MPDLNLFVPLAKVDIDHRLVHGIVTAEVPDRSGEICDYVSTKPYYETWSAEATEASGGKSLGAVRSMHGRVAAGKLTDITFDDDEKRILVAAKIVDDDEWKKVEEGVYTGFSQGGRYVARWPDPDSGLTRYTAEPREISLVDLPCLPSATFEVVKNGVSARRAFAAKPAAEKTFAREALAASAALGAGDEADEASAHIELLDELLRLAREISGKLDKEATSVAALTGARPEAVASEDHREASGVEAASASKVAAPPSATANEPAPSPELVKALGEAAALRSEVQDFAPKLAALAARVAALEAQPLPAKAAIRAVSKASDASGEAAASVEEAVKRLAALPSEERAYALMKISLANPIRRV